MKFLKSTIVMAAAVVGIAITSPVFAQGATAAKGAASFVKYVGRMAERDGIVVVEGVAKEAERLGVSEVGVGVAYTSARNALRGLFKDAENASKPEIRKTLFAAFSNVKDDPILATRFLDGTGRALKPEELVELALKPVNELTAKEQGALTSALALAAEKTKAGDALSACGGCVEQELKNIGLFVVARALKPIEADFYKNLPDTGRELNAMVQSRLAKIKAFKVRVDPGDLAKLTITEQKSFIFALERGIDGSEDQKAFFKALAAFSKKDGEIDIMATRLWTLLTPLPDSDKFVSVEALDQITKELTAATKAEKTSLKNRKQHVSEWFDAIAKEKGMEADRAEMRRKNCFGLERV